MANSVGFMRRWAMQRSPLLPPEIVDLSVPKLTSAELTASVVGQIQLPLLEKPNVNGAVFTIPLRAKVSTNFVELKPPFVLDNSGALTWSAPRIYEPVQAKWQPVDIHEIIGADWQSTDFYEVALADWSPAQVADEFAMIAAPAMANMKFAVFDSYPQIIDCFTGLATPGKSGKAYNRSETLEQASLFASAKRQRAAVARVAEPCIHGLQPAYCEICRHKQTNGRQQSKKRAKPVRTVDVFDLLLPYLQPPLEQLLAQPVLFPTDRRPRDYQVTGIKFLAAHEAALLGDEMGLGKTIQTIIALQVLYRRGDVRQTLILCPRSLLGTWEKELDKWAPELFVQKVRGTKEERDTLWRSHATVYLTTYETLRGDIKSLPVLTTKFQVVILDEVQKIKNPESELARAVRRLHTQYRWGLSGTPLENKIEDVTAIYRYLVPALFKRDGVYTVQQVKNAIEPYFLRRRTADVIKELPEKEIQEVWLELTESQQSAYRRLEEDGKQRLAKADANRMHVFALINQLKKICNIEAKTGESCKLDYLIEQLDSVVENNQKALVFSHLPNETLSKIEPMLKAFHPALFDGKLSDKRREAIIHDFQTQPYPSVLLMSVQSGGVGLTLTRASHVFHFDHWWNPAIARQAEGRAHRMGQEQTVFVHDLYTVNTIEERIHKLLQGKQALFDAVIDDLSAEYIQKSIDDFELFGLFDLAPPVDPDPSTPNRIGQRVRQLFQPKREREFRAEIQVSEPKPAKTLNNLSPPEFEQFVANLYHHMGYKARVTRQSRDHGVDIVAKRATHLGVEELIIQCKHYPERAVGEPDLRNLLGAWQEFPQAQYAVLVTSGRFTNDALIFAEKHRIKLIDRQELLQLVQQHRK